MGSRGQFTSAHRPPVHWLTVCNSPVTPAQTSATLLGDESRKQRRRECHNQVEKRRREHINAMIEELNKLLPSKFKMPDPDMAIEDDDEDDANTQESPVKKKVREIKTFDWISVADKSFAEVEADSFHVQAAKGIGSMQGPHTQ